MTRYEIPDQKERLCITCSRGEGDDFEKVETKQIPIAVEVRWGSRSCWGVRRGIEWKWECLECHEVQH